MRYLIVEKTKGVFLGAYSIFALFAKNDKFGIVKAYSFSTKQDAEEYIEDSLKASLASEGLEFSVIEIDSKDEYVKVEDIIKQGYGEYTHMMMDNLPMISESVH